MSAVIKRGHRFFRRWEPYVGLLSLTGFFGWLGRQLKVFGQLGWAESIFVGLIAALACASILAMYRYFRPLAARAPELTAQKDPPPLITIEGRHYYNCEVVLDGHSYIACQFFNVTFMYGGGPSRLSHNEIHGCHIRPTSPALDDYTGLLFELGFLRHPVFGPEGKPLQPTTKFIAEKANDEGN